MKRKALKKNLKTLRGAGGSSMYMETGRFNAHIKNVLLPKAKVATGMALLAIALELDRRIMLGWPVDTGRSRAAWSALLEKHGMPMPPTGGANVSPAAETEGKALGASEEKLVGARQSIALINGVDYSPVLEVGWSNQAPKGVVRREMRLMRGEPAKEFKKTYKDVR